MTRRIPWTLIIFLIALCVPWLGSRYYTFLGTQIAIQALFAVSLNLLLGTTGLVSFGHAAYFGIGSYVCGILMKTLGVPFLLAFPAGGLIAAAFALRVRLLLRAPDQDLLRDADPRLRADRLGHLFQMERRDRRRPGAARRAVSRSRLDGVAARASATSGSATCSTLLVLTLVALCIAALHRISDSPFGRMLTTIRENPERAAFIGVNVRAYELAAFTIAGGFAGLAGRVVRHLQPRRLRRLPLTGRNRPR